MVGDLSILKAKIKMLDPFLAFLLLMAVIAVFAVPAYDLGRCYGFMECMKTMKNKREKETE